MVHYNLTELGIIYVLPVTGLKKIGNGKNNTYQTGEQRLPYCK
jgi:hypothetical protein